jgi:hypothetical protein
MNPTNPPFKTFLLKRIINDGRLSYKVKCISLGVVPYLFGFVVTQISGTVDKYVRDYGFLTLSLAASVTFSIIIYACRQIEPTLSELDHTVHHSEHERFPDFCEATKNEIWKDEQLSSAAGRLSPFHWYIIHIAIPTSFLLVLALVGSAQIGPNWLTEISPYGFAWDLNFAYYLLWLVLMGYIIGVSANRLGYYGFLINDYCKKFVLCGKRELDFCNPIACKSLRPVGRLALKFNLALSLPPTLAIVVLMGKGFGETHTTFITSPPLVSITSITLLATYSAVLLFAFFYPIKHVHKSMELAKEKALLRIENQMKNISDNISELGGMMMVKEQAMKASTWPFDTSLFIKVMVSVLFPVIAGAFLQVALERLLVGSLFGLLVISIIEKKRWKCETFSE